MEPLLCRIISRRDDLLLFFVFGPMVFFSVKRFVIPLVSVLTGVSLLIDFRRLMWIFRSEYVFQMDFSHLYLTGKALRAGVYLYSPLPELAQQFDARLLAAPLPHPSPYPPVLGALIGALFASLSYVPAAFAWEVFEVSCLVISLVVIARHFGGKSAPLPVVLTVLLFLCWRPLYMDLLFGQVMLLVLLLLTLSWFAARSGRDIWAGVLLGFVFSLKLYAWPILLFFALRRRWYTVSAAAFVFLSFQLIGAAWFGSGLITDYYLRVAPTVGAVWRADLFNFSAWAIGYRLFGPMGAIGLATLTLALSIVSALRAREFDDSFMIMLTASTILSPIAWVHYFVTLLPALCLVAARQRFTSRDLIAMVLVLALLSPGIIQLDWPDPRLWTSLPFIGVLGTIWIISSAPRNMVSTLQGERAILQTT